LSYIEYKFEITNAKLKDFAAKNNADELLSFQNAMNDIDKNIQTSKASQVDILRRFEKFESSALQMATDYKLINSTKDSIESLNNTVLQLKNSSELNNKMQIDGFKDQVSQLQASYETLLKNSSQISNENQKIVKEFQVLQKNWSVIASLEKNIQDINKKIIGIEEFNKLVLKDLNAHQSKLNTHEDWLKSINRR
jgi:predicted  nucleic acid-binding Zn-ribbon protein